MASAFDMVAERARRVLIELGLAKLLRFATVGAANGVIYALATTIAVAGLHTSAVVGSLAGYVTVFPFAFFAHKRFTFRSADPASSMEVTRFLVTYVTGLLISIAAMHVVTRWFGLHFVFGIAAAIALVPLLTFHVLDRWVFGTRQSQ